LQDDAFESLGIRLGADGKAVKIANRTSATMMAGAAAVIAAN
jgi:hypothetical protein